MTGPQPRVVRFGEYRLDPASRELIGADGAAVALTGKAFEVLLYLIEHAPRVVSKDELLAQVWAGRVVDENNLTQAISTLRKALGTGAGDHRYILTEARRGYRFVAALETPETEVAAPSIAASPPESAPSSTHPSARRPWLRWGALAVGLLAVALLATTAWRERAPRGAATRPATDPTTLAVLPFRSIGGGRDVPARSDAMLELGLAETLIARLSRATSLRVLSMGSVQGFAGHRGDPLRAGMTLGADYVIEGSTQQLGDRIRVNARLLSLPDGRTVWAGTFDETPSRVFTLQDVLAEGVSSALSLRYAAAAGDRSACEGADADAYRAFLRGRYLINRPGPARATAAITAFQDAIARDPGCARAWVGLSIAYRILAITADRDPREVGPLSAAAIAHALELDPASAEAHTSRGLNQFWFEWDWAGAETSMRRALALDGDLAEAHSALAHLFANIGRADEALPHARQAAVLDPLSPIVNTLAAGFVNQAGHADEARRRLETSLQLEPDFWVALLSRGAMAAAGGDDRGAIRDLGRARELSDDNSHVLSMLGRAYLRAGQRDQAEQVLRDLEAKRDRTGYIALTSLAAMHNALGDGERALDLLAEGHRTRDIRMVFLKVDRGWDNLRPDPRFRALMQRMNLQPEPASGRP